MDWRRRFSLACVLISVPLAVYGLYGLVTEPQALLGPGPESALRFEPPEGGDMLVLEWNPPNKVCFSDTVEIDLRTGEVELLKQPPSAAARDFWRAVVRAFPQAMAQLCAERGSDGDDTGTGSAARLGR